MNGNDRPNHATALDGHEPFSLRVHLHEQINQNSELHFTLLSIIIQIPIIIGNVVYTVDLIDSWYENKWTLKKCQSG